MLEATTTNDKCKPEKYRPEKGEAIRLRRIAARWNEYSLLVYLPKDHTDEQDRRAKTH